MTLTFIDETMAAWAKVKFRSRLHFKVKMRLTWLSCEKQVDQLCYQRGDNSRLHRNFVNLNFAIGEIRLFHTVVVLALTGR